LDLTYDSNLKIEKTNIFPGDAEEQSVLTVSQITGAVKRTLEDNFGQIDVIGEISNFKAHVSGHWYFTLKDENAQISCTMWRSVNSRVFFSPQDGMKVVVSGRLTVYPPRGSYQIDVRSMKAAGEGELQAAFERLKKKLFEEGLFEESIKKRIPQLPEKIGIVTAIDGAAFKDMISVAERRYPLAELIIAPSRVQGEGAAEDIANNIKILNEHGSIDVIIIGRGGGSLEDLWAFNEEIVARAVFNSHVPVISGVGHEIDFTIADFAADLRAPTPTAAMELATPNMEDIKNFIEENLQFMGTNIENKMNSYAAEIENILNSYAFKKPENLLQISSQTLDNYLYKFDTSFEHKILKIRNRVQLLMQIVNSHDSKRILQKGYSLVKQNNNYITRADLLELSAPFEIQFSDKKIKIDHDKEKK
jgi:exodeoxyribonuclease VII large subunit